MILFVFFFGHFLIYKQKNKKQKKKNLKRNIMWQIYDLLQEIHQIFNKLFLGANVITFPLRNF